MKVRNVTITNFRGLKELHLDFVNPRTNDARNLACLIGDNGSGKTTALQAIALVLLLATNKITRLSEFHWHGFFGERVSTLGPTSIEIEVEFSSDEMLATRNLHTEWLSYCDGDNSPDELRFATDGQELPPASVSPVKLQFSGGRLQPTFAGQLAQFLGRYFIREIRNGRRTPTQSEESVGGVFWFDQYRNLGARLDSETGQSDERTSWQAGVEQLREYLVGMWGFHTSPGPKLDVDYISELAPLVSRIFPGTTFKGIAPKANGMHVKASDFYFLLERDGRTYDIAEMASGEQAVFSLLYEFVRLRISNSVVLIDELELHLHPPQQQALLALLSTIGPTCQFIITTHSPYLSNAIPEDRVHRMERGVRCL